MAIQLTIRRPVGGLENKGYTISIWFQAGYYTLGIRIWYPGIIQYSSVSKFLWDHDVFEYSTTAESCSVTEQDCLHRKLKELNTCDWDCVLIRYKYPRLKDECKMN